MLSLQRTLVFLLHFTCSLQSDGESLFGAGPFDILHKSAVTSTCMLSRIYLGYGKGMYSTTGSWYTGTSGLVLRVVVNLFTLVRDPWISSTMSCRSGLLTFLGMMTLGLLFYMSSLRLLSTSRMCLGFSMKRGLAPSISDTSRLLILLSRKARRLLATVRRLMLT